MTRIGRPDSLLLLGLAIREGFSFWTGHPYDFEVWIRTGHVVAAGTNPYVSFWGSVPGVSFAYLDQPLPSAAYPPFWPAVTGLIYRGWAWGGGGDRFLLYFLLKQPVIVADVGVAVLLGRTVRSWTGDEAKAARVRTFWLFFPYAIVVSAIWGQIDAILLLTVLVALRSAGAVRRGLAEGVGIFVKWLPVVFVPLEFFRERGVRRLVAGGILLVPVLLTLLSFWAAGWTFVGFPDTTRSETSGGGGGMNFAQFFENPTIAKAILSVPNLLAFLTLLWIPAVVAAGYLAAGWSRTGGPGQVVRAMLFVTAIFLALRWGLNEQYMVYVFALLLLDVVAFHPQRARLFYGLVALSSAYLLVNNDLGIWFASPVWPSLFTLAVNIDEGTKLGGIRADALLVLAVLVALTILQLIRALVRDDPSPGLWWWPVSARTPPAAPAPEP